MPKPGSSKKLTIARVVSLCIIIAAVSLSSCGGGGGGGAVPNTTCTCSSGTPFWAADFTNNSLQCVCANLIDTGTHSRIFAENTFSLTPADVAWVKSAFDNDIYPADTANFGSEPNPGIDGDPLITILLMNIRDGYNGTTVKSYTAGYFDPGNEYPLTANPYSNRREMFYMNINPNLPLTQTAFNTTLAHEFQHMIHWEQKIHLRNLDDDIWLNEAMSEIAPTFLYGRNCSRIYTYERDPSNSLTTWNGDIFDYGIVYMWSEYYKEQFGGSIFKSMMTTTSTGITSVNQALAALPSSRTFTSTFNDLSIAIGSGIATPPWWKGHPEWTYSFIETWASTCDTISLPGLFGRTDNNSQNPTTLPALGPWSIGFSWYTPVSGTTGTVTWTASSPSQEAAFIDWGTNTLSANIASGSSNTFNTNGLLIVRNPSSGSFGTGGGVLRTAPLAIGPAIYQSPKMMLDAANVQSQAEGRPHNVCVHSALLEREKELRMKGFKPGF